MQIQYWGVRGSVAVPGPTTVRYGGNTSCVAVEFQDSVLVIDAGTGIVPLGRHLRQLDRRIFILFSHLHLDHISGFPLFAPLYDAGSAVTLIGFENDGVDWFPTEMFDGVHFPADVRALPASIAKAPSSLTSTVIGPECEVAFLRVNHPGGANAVRIRTDTGTFVHVPDNELVPESRSWVDLVSFCAGAEVFSHDAQYTEEEYGSKEGWGHSSWERVCRFAKEAAVGHVVLCHHDPDRSDDELDDIQRHAARVMNGMRCTVAREGLRLEI